MSDGPTPETDAVLDHSRKLERERDELQDALEHAQMTISSIVSPSDKATLELIKVTKERDEAREQAQRLRVQLNHYSQVNELAEEAFRERDEIKEKYRFAVIHWQIGAAKMERERDEALSQRNALAASLEYIASAGLTARHCEDEAKKMLALIFEKEGTK